MSEKSNISWTDSTHNFWRGCTKLLVGGGCANCYAATLVTTRLGGESGKKARPCNVEWIRSIVQQCKSAGVPCFVKQLGSCAIFQTPDGTLAENWNHWPTIKHPKGGDPSEWPEDLRIQEFYR